MDYLLHICILATVYFMLAISLDLLAGHSGFISLAQAGFYGIGAYTSALLAVYLKLPFFVGVIAGMLIAAMISLIVSLPSLRLHGDYFVIATFGFQMILFSVFNNWIELTRGPLGIPGIPPPAIFAWTINSKLGYFALVACFAALAYASVRRIATSPFGRVLHSLREDEVFAQSLGKNVMRFKVVTFAVSAALAAAAGSLYAHYVTFIDPTSFTALESILVISMVIIGGASSRWGPLIGAVVLVMLPELLRFFGLPKAVAANLRQIIYGLLLVVMMLLRPRGLAGKQGFER
jgi:branched-chain amino acid transport system permease protein